MSQWLKIKFINNIINNLKLNKEGSTEYELLHNVIIRDKNVCDIIKRCVKNGSALDNTIRYSMIRTITDSDINCSCYNGWLLGYYIVMHTGNFDVAYEFRENAKKCLYGLNGSRELDNETLFKLLSLALEEENDNLYFDIRNKILTNNEKEHSKIKHFDILHSFCTGSESEFLKDYINDNVEFYNYINNKKVSLVTPTEVSSFDAKDIDSSDVVVRINYSSQGQGCDSSHKGNKTDLSYYNKVTMKKVCDENQGELPIDLKFSVHKPGSESSSNNARSFISFDDVLLNGAFNMIPNALFDLLLFTPKKIKIYHSDMQVKPTVRVKNYYETGSILNDGEEYKKSFSRSFSIHDPFGQFHLMKRIVRNNKRVIVDEGLSKVLDLSIDDYARQLTDNYKPKKKDKEDSLTREIAKLKAELNDKKEELKVTLVNLKTNEEKIHYFEKIISQKDNKIAKQKRLNLALKRSLSWRVTRPLRSISEFFRGK